MHIYLSVYVCVHHTTLQIRVSLHSKDMGWAESTSPSEFVCTSFIPLSFRGHRGHHALTQHALLLQFTLFLLRLRPVWHCVPQFQSWFVFFWTDVEVWHYIYGLGGGTNSKANLLHYLVNGGIIQCYMKGSLMPTIGFFWCHTSMSFLFSPSDQNNWQP